MNEFLSRNLSCHQRTAFRELKKKFIDQLEDQAENDFIIYRFLKARKFNVDEAEMMLGNHLRFRHQYKLDTILEDYRPEEPMTTYCPLNFLGFDKEGAIGMFTDVGNFDMLGIQRNIPMEGLKMYVLYHLELIQRKVFEKTEELGRLAGVTMIADFEDFTLMMATNKTGLEIISELIRMYEAHYPELMKSMYVVNAPIYFNYVFVILKRLVPAETIQKVHIFGKNGWRKELLKHIDPEVLPAFLGGEKRDPDGNPNCFTTMRRVKLGSRQYSYENSEHQLKYQADVKRYNLKCRSKIHITHEVNTIGSFIDWQFESESRDVGFGLLFKTNYSEACKELIPVERMNAHLQRETGTFMCEKAGIYMMVLDNSFSWFRRKHIYLKSCIRKPQQ